MIYRSVNAALRHAFRAEVSAPMAASSVYAMRGPGRDAEALSALDATAQAGMVLQLARRTLGPVDWPVVAGYYRVAWPGAPAAAKIADLTAVAAHLMEHGRVPPSCPVEYVMSVTLRWGGMIQPSDGRWSRQLGVSMRQLRRWRLMRAGDAQRPVGLETQLHGRLDEAERRLHPVMAERGLVPAGDGRLSSGR